MKTSPYGYFTSRRYGSRLKPTVLMFLVSLVAAATCFAQTTALLYNLNAPGPGQPGIGDINTILPGKGFGVGFTLGATSYSVSSLTLEFNGNSLPAPGLNIQILSFGQPGSVPAPGVPLVPYGQLANPTLSSQPTLWPGSTTFVNFTPTSQIILQPNTSYVIAAWEDGTGNDDNALLFGYSASYTYGGDVQLPRGGPAPQYTLGPFVLTLPGQTPYPNNVWANESSRGGEAPVLELDVTAAPEPQVWALALPAVATASLVRRRGQNIAK